MEMQRKPERDKTNYTNAPWTVGQIKNIKRCYDTDEYGMRRDPEIGSTVLSRHAHKLTLG